MADVGKAASFVETHGDDIERARLGSILFGTPPTREVMDALSSVQNPDGGFSYWVKGFSNVVDTVWILKWCDDLGLGKHPIVKNAIGFLLKRQREDGGWDEVEEVRGTDPPHYVVPGVPENRVWITADVAHWFVRLGYAEPPDARGCPVKFLLAHREPSGRLRGYLRATWDALVMFSYHPGPDSDVFVQTLAAMEKEFSPEKWEGSYLAWLGTCLRDAGVPGTHPLVGRCIEALSEKQRGDGSWDSEDGEKFRVNATLEALRVMAHYSRVDVKNPP